MKTIYVFGLLDVCKIFILFVSIVVEQYLLWMFVFIVDGISKRFYGNIMVNIENKIGY